MFRERKTNLDDVNISDIYPPPDQGITNLVKAIRSLGHLTMGSCEGGLEGSHHIDSFPWVTVYGVGFEDVVTHQQITDILERFNKKGGVQWTTDWSTVRPEKVASNRTELKRLQASADELAMFIFDEQV